MLAVEVGQHVVQQPAAAERIGFEDEVAERFEAEHVFHEEIGTGSGRTFPTGWGSRDVLCRSAGRGGRTAALVSRPSAGPKLFRGARAAMMRRPASSDVGDCCRIEGSVKQPGERRQLGRFARARRGATAPTRQSDALSGVAVGRQR